MQVYIVGIGPHLIILGLLLHKSMVSALLLTTCTRERVHSNRQDDVSATTC